MNKPTEYHKFYDDGNNKRELENFQNYFFKDIDLRNAGEPISFFRSDFRSTKLVNSHFDKNNFDRADFIDAYLEDCSFNECDFGTDFINTYFKNVSFSKNDFGTCTFNECMFDSCTFNGDSITNTGYRQCEYINCNIESCFYEMNTLDDLSFKDSHLKNINFANSSAHNFNFDTCRFQNLTIDPDYLGSYLFKQTSLENISFTYKGQNLDFSNKMTEVFEGLRNFYAVNKRYADWFNLNLLYNNLINDSRSVTPLFQGILTPILTDEHVLRKRNNINNIFRTLQFYAGTSIISTDDYFSILGTLEGIQDNKLDFRSKIEFDANLSVTKDLFEKEIFVNTIEISRYRQIYCEVQIDEDDFTQAKSLLENLFLKLQQQYYPDDDVTNTLSIIGTHRGSLYIEIVGYAGAVIAFCRAIKCIFSSGIRIYVQYAFVKKAINLLDDKKSIAEIGKAVQTINLILKEPVDKTEKEFSALSKILKSVNIFPNALEK